MSVEVIVYEIVHALRGDRALERARDAVTRLTRQTERRRVVVARLEYELDDWAPHHRR